MKKSKWSEEKSGREKKNKVPGTKSKGDRQKRPVSFKKIKKGAMRREGKKKVRKKVEETGAQKAGRGGDDEMSVTDRRERWRGEARALAQMRRR